MKSIEQVRSNMQKALEEQAKKSRAYENDLIVEKSEKLNKINRNISLATTWLIGVIVIFVVVAGVSIYIMTMIKEDYKDLQAQKRLLKIEGVEVLNYEGKTYIYSETRKFYMRTPKPETKIKSLIEVE